MFKEVFNINVKELCKKKFKLVGLNLVIFAKIKELIFLQFVLLIISLIFAVFSVSYVSIFLERSY